MDLKESLKYLKLRESAISMILGALVIIVSGILLVNYFAKRNGGEVTQINIGDEAITPTAVPNSHTIASGENLWTIAEKYYGNGYYWTEIARANNLTNADAIIVGQTISIPQISATPSVQAAGIGMVGSGTSTPTQLPVSTSTPAITITATPSPVTTTTPLVTRNTETPTTTPTVFTGNGQGAISTEAKSHTVQNGESLWKIAETYYQSGYNWTDIASANKLTNANVISAGQVLIIPNVQSKTATIGIGTVISAENTISGTTYTVQEGDSLWNISIRAYGNGFRWSEIARENHLVTPGIIHKGNILALPR